jgi:hypothetical protein
MRLYIWAKLLTETGYKPHEGGSMKSNAVEAEIY